MEREIITYPNEVLSRKSDRIEEVTPDIQELAEDMIRIMYDNDGIGLAAPQVAENQRIITVDVSGPEKREDLRVFINPELVYTEGEVETEEGCLSVVGYRASVKRAARVKLHAMDLKGQEVDVDADEMLSVCLQHEIDHLDGILFIDRISRLKRSLYDKKLNKWRSKRKK